MSILGYSKGDIEVRGYELKFGSKTCRPGHEFLSLCGQ